MAVPNGDAQILAAAAAGRGEPRVGGEDGEGEYNAKVAAPRRQQKKG